ncbi:hypothetical protein DPMN_112747 [Dreissena polymorpha]|uniref:Uncharacterized protein n=1 Tax=Dreissena polymorpha TaxID=45954 RepID=A0A9D4KGZ8_DREPO|nr:hypothetical protein DPMN_112747 [Dreissena polymorpha]
MRNGNKSVTEVRKTNWQLYAPPKFYFGEHKKGASGLVMGPCIIKIDNIVIREVKYQFEVNQCRNEEIIVKGNFGWVWSMWAGCPRVDNWAMHKIQYQFEVNRCRNEVIIVQKAILGRVWSMSLVCGRGAPGLLMGLCIVEFDRIVIREVQYQFEVNQCRNEEVNGCIGVGVGTGDGLGKRVCEKSISDWLIDKMWAELANGQLRADISILTDLQFQGSSANSVGEDSGQERRMKGQTDRRRR